MSKKQSSQLLVVIISGATGRTAFEVVKSALAQFEEAQVRILKKKGVRSSAAATRIIRDIPDGPAVILHSLVSSKVRETVVQEGRRRMIPTVDVLGPVIAVLSDQLGSSPQGKPGLSYKRHKDDIDRMAAVSFTIEHDDGAGLKTLYQADVVLVGVSRASKSVTCFYLGYRGIRAANVPLIQDIPAPAELVKMPAEKVIGLTVSPRRLQNVREARRERFGAGAMRHYVDHRAVNDELRYGLMLMKKHHWRSIDVSYMAVEEVAVQVLQMIGKA